MIYRALKRLQRKSQLSILKKHPGVFMGSITIGIDNNFILHRDLRNFNIGNSVSFRNYSHILVYENASLSLGNNFFMNNFCSINCIDHISIGDNTLFGENVKLYDHDHLYQTSPEFQLSRSDFRTAPIRIGKNCWLGSNVTVLKGVTIGDNCIIGAGCTVHKDVPPNSIVINKQELILKN